MEEKVRATNPGPRNNPRSLISSGIPTLDQLLGGGFPPGSLVLVEEDARGSYAKVLLKYFLAEGVVSGQALFVCSKDANPESIVKDLPALVETDPEPEEEKGQDKMVIAFRYAHLPTGDDAAFHKLDHYYDLSRNMPESKLQKADVTYWHENAEDVDGKGFQNPQFLSLLEALKFKLKLDAKSALRVGIHSLGSPLWLPENDFNFSALSKDLNLFFYALRGLMHSHFSTALVTVPSHLFEEGFVERWVHSSDIVLKLEAFSGTIYENNKSLSDYHGFFHIKKLAAINSLVSKHPGAVEYVFKLKKKKFKIQKLHLPPDIQDAPDDAFSNKNRPAFACGSGASNKLLDF